MKKDTFKIGVIGLGYVGLPLSVALARHYEVVGCDINAARIAALRAHHDATGEVESTVLKTSALKVTDRIQDLADCNLYIVTVPTPVTANNTPDLEPLRKASIALAPLLKKGDVVVYESTVYPGVTEDFCGPFLEAGSGLVAGKDFFLGYSPERINPGDKLHTVETITKVVAAQTPELTDRLAEVYGTVNGGNIFKAASIRTAEAAKVIENTQRDINVAFMNEITRIFHALDLSVYDVLEAAKTKWNFLPFQPGLVGGHCISVDPYYLAHVAQEKGVDSHVILSGRTVNEDMGSYIAGWMHDHLVRRSHVPGEKRVLMLGLAFKENVPDLRNTKILSMVEALEARGYHVDVHDPMTDPIESEEVLGRPLLRTLGGDIAPYDAICAAVPHQAYTLLSPSQIQKLLGQTGILFDLKGFFKDKAAGNVFSYIRL